MTFNLDGKKIFVTGHNGMVGSAIVRRLAQDGIPSLTAGRKDVDLRDQASVRGFMERERPDVVVIAAAKVGGIHANNTQPADFIYENLMIASNLIEAAHRTDVQKLLFLGSSCIYPRLAPQPINEDSLLTGPLEPTNEWYALAKISGIKLCQAYRKQHGRDYISCQPTNLYGPNDNFNLSTSHVLPALLRKAHEAKIANAPSMTVWGTGTPLREFLHVDDMADACVYLLRNYSGDVPLNVGWGEDISIGDVARLIKDTVGFKGELVFDTTKPDGTPRKLLDTGRINGLGWRPKIELSEGLKGYYEWFLAHQADFRD
ncbi:GDP-L-fucose synthase [Microvirga flavescens]|uniref:GDP-L-fucose synthase n=1 Tax=Microvirga flavescens TaxID=2249811 RepID=UPI000DD7FC4B|nr:GDP-L-fucose synthase [Microvirga flavescens]